MKTFTLTAKTLFGLEAVLASEIKSLGGTDIEIRNRAVQYTADQELLFKSNLCLRTALFILRPISVFDAGNEQQLYRQVRQTDWSQYLTPRQTFAISSTTNSRLFRHSKFVALKVKDAIVDQFRQHTGQRPSIDTKDPDLAIDVHIYDHTCTISLNASGASLAKRGYGAVRSAAPINEVLAAGILLMSEWKPDTSLTDPMCGSGTIPIEAAMIAANIPPGHLRHFNFEKWNSFDPLLWKEIKKEEKKKIRRPATRIAAKDLSAPTLRIAIKNAGLAKVDHLIQFEQADFFDSKPTGESGVVIMNPPYGERLKQKDLNRFYSEIGTRLKHYYEGSDAWILSGNREALKHIGLKPSRKISLFNGPIACKLHRYELYGGSRKRG